LKLPNVNSEAVAFDKY